VNVSVENSIEILLVIVKSAVTDDSQDVVELTVGRLDFDTLLAVTPEFDGRKIVAS
jgi:hypothetical protein